MQAPYFSRRTLSPLALGELLIDAEEDKYLRAVLVGLLREQQR